MTISKDPMVDHLLTGASPRIRELLKEKSTITLLNSFSAEMRDEPSDYSKHVIKMLKEGDRAHTAAEITLWEEDGELKAYLHIGAVESEQYRKLQKEAENDSDR
jgi:hypothetical protein